MTAETTRKSLLEELLRFEDPRQLGKIMKQLREYGWDSEVELVRLDFGVIISLLKRFLDGEITAQQLEDWGNAVEQRDDIEFGMGNSPWILDAISELANPALHQPLTPDTMGNLLLRLERLHAQPDKTWKWKSRYAHTHYLSFEITHQGVFNRDTKQVEEGFYLQVADEKGNYTHELIYGTLEAARQKAFEKWNVPLDSWVEANLYLESEQ